MNDFLLTRVIIPGIMAIAAVVIVALVAVAIYYANSEKLTLTKAEWVCTRSETVLMPMPAGKVMVTIPQQQCVQYSRQ
ncbi:hypothetical protein C7441_112182 [Pseudaminobacter salicylatoxidans]|uniref:Uncharacterized protein n=1 Tax=Pseudaminobacter salicylatoxidans TaxID=93369 RepID=A0A316BZW2_PSESE|nr:hypothetical protein [Pseudaminobacter salicylatoxidans]PWJ80640.1 hypothetical protein C7441_112182 [Pseudaminobacter salicylatoxidans]